MSIEAFVTAYGYPAVLVGTILEGETTLIMAGFLAHRGYLSLPVVLAVAFFGTFTGDQIFYQMGRCKGMAMLDKHPHWCQRTDRVFHLLHRHQIKLILGFRFLYGLRSVTPFVIGASGIPMWRYLSLSVVGGVIWTAVVGSLGYLLGNTLAALLREVRHYEGWILALIALTGLTVWGIRRARERRQARHHGHRTHFRPDEGNPPARDTQQPPPTKEPPLT